MPTSAEQKVKEKYPEARVEPSPSASRKAQEPGTNMPEAGNEVTLENEAQYVCGEAYQLIGAINFVNPGLIPNVEKWLDNLSRARLVHSDLLPVILDKSRPAQPETPDETCAHRIIYGNESGAWCQKCGVCIGGSMLQEPIITNGYIGSISDSVTIAEPSPGAPRNPITVSL